jgi:uncharacterized protein YndB with AHSA1/START domain
MMNTIVTSTQVYNHPVEMVWRALSEESALKKWFFPVQHYQFEKGREFRFYESEDSNRFLHRCRFSEIIPMQLIAYTWEFPEFSSGISLVQWQLEQIGDQTRVTLTHSGLEAFAEAGDDFKPENFQFGWDHFVHDVLRLYLNGIEKLVFKMPIHATAEKIWETLWDKETYKQWTEPFTIGSYYAGDIQTGNRIHFLTPEGHGMYSNVAFIKENNHVVFQHIGEMAGFEELPPNEQTLKWKGSCESYQLLSADNGMLLRVEVDTDATHLTAMNEIFPVALQRLKEICEKD